MEQSPTNNKLLQTLTDSIPESLVKNSLPGFTSVSSVSSDSPTSDTSSWFSSLSDSWITIIIVLIGAVFLLINFIAYYFEGNEYLPNVKQLIANIYIYFLNTYHYIYSYISRFFQDICLETNETDQIENNLHVADGSQSFLKKQGDHPLENVPQIHNLEENIHPPFKKQTTKNQRQAGQFNQMPGITSGKRVGQHVASDTSQQSYDNYAQDSLEKDLQNAAQGITNSTSYSADDTNSAVQTKSKAGWCFIGQDNNIRNCIKVGENDNCLSGDIFPTSDICVNPNLRT